MGLTKLSSLNNLLLRIQKNSLCQLKGISKCKNIQSLKILIDNRSKNLKSLNKSQEKRLNYKEKCKTTKQKEQKNLNKKKLPNHIFRLKLQNHKVKRKIGK